MTSTNRQTIVVGIIYNKTKDKILISQRSDHVHQGGLWEFPGGKKIKNESQFSTLKREIHEEIDITINQSHHLVSYEYDYTDKPIRLCAWIIDHWDGVPKANESQKIEWVDYKALSKIDFPTANKRLITTLALAPIYVITPNLKEYDVHFYSVIEELLKNGLKILQFRSPLISAKQHQVIVEKLVTLCEKYACKLIYNGKINDAIGYGAHGVHLSSDRLMKEKIRPVSEMFLVGASCHNEIELLHAERIGLDYCVLSLVHQSTSHINKTGMGWKKFFLLSQLVSIPVYALGGVMPSEFKIARKNGSHGIAMISGVWSCPDPGLTIKSIDL